jgi:preprotein translocase subunit SecG
MVLTYFLNDFEMVPVAPIITGITLVIIIFFLLLLLLLCVLSKAQSSCRCKLL